MLIDSSEVSRIFRECLFEDNMTDKEKQDALEKAIKINGVRFIVGFNPEKIKKYESQIKNMVSNISDRFIEGYSFLGFCNDKNEVLWTGSHSTMEELLCLGLAIKELNYCCPKEMWASLPMGIPYIYKRKG